ncbi:BTB/POZ and MATH domain-containing protein 1-like [Panicum miliaceum]|uniref:BTB/POZ and MATH domain-containing protein 1-like n=1 Tax=Panicum miliaceum TaxID=4540 RepID=A0A3L6PMV3_PANMI|nr:BTB/POZ and MATH domain-containing protein 1-like [Panicum miliaceum]
MPRQTLNPKTVSTCTAETEHGNHVFEVFDYSQHRGMGTGEYIRSGIFFVGGYDRAIRFYPDGMREVSKDYIAVYLELLSKDTKVRASCDLRLVDQSTGLSAPATKVGLRTFDSNNNISRFAPHVDKFMNRSELEASVYLHGDHLTIHCIVTVMKDPRVSKTELFN